MNWKVLYPPWTCLQQLDFFHNSSWHCRHTASHEPGYLYMGFVCFSAYAQATELQNWVLFWRDSGRGCLLYWFSLLSGLPAWRAEAAEQPYMAARLWGGSRALSSLHLFLTTQAGQLLLLSSTPLHSPSPDPLALRASQRKAAFYCQQSTGLTNPLCSPQNTASAPTRPRLGCTSSSSEKKWNI